MTRSSFRAAAIFLLSGQTYGSSGSHCFSFFPTANVSKTFLKSVPGYIVYKYWYYVCVNPLSVSFP